MASLLASKHVMGGIRMQRQVKLAAPAMTPRVVVAAGARVAPKVRV